MRSKAKQNALKTILSSLYRQHVGVFVNKLPTKINYSFLICNLSSLHCKARLTQLNESQARVEQTKSFKLNKYKFKMAY